MSDRETDPRDALIARFRIALEQIRDRPECLTDNPDFGSGHDVAREGAAEIAREALESD